MLHKSELIYVDHYQNFSVFNSSNLHTSKNIHQTIKIRKIQFRDCNKITMKKVLLKNLNINPYIVDNVRNINTHAKRIIQRLKFSGYISRIKIFHFNFRYSKHISLHFTINPIIKKITILNYKNLQIPSSFLKNLFQQQIGMPKNFRILNDILNRIDLWYKSRGFTWVNIEILEQDTLNNIYIKIKEGIIKSTILNCQTNSIYDPKMINTLDSLIKKELNIEKGDILNIKIIEAGIRRLINLNFIKDCNYLIKRDEKGLMIVVNYNALENHTAYIYNYSSIVERYFNYKKLYNLLINNLTHFKLFNKNFIYLHKLNVYSSIINIDHYLNLKYKSYYSIKNISNIFVNLITIKDYPQLNIIFSHPYICRQKNFLHHLIINFYNKIIKSNLFYPFIVLQFNEVNDKQRSNLLIYLNTVIFTLKHNLFKNIHVLEKSWVTYNRYNKINIELIDYRFNHLLRKPSLIQTTFSSIAKLSKNVKNRFLYLKISMTYNNLYFWDQLETGKLLILYSKLFTYITKNSSKTCNELSYLGQNVGLKYMHVFNLPKIFRYIYYHALIMFSECYFSLNSQTYGPILQQSYNNHHSVFFKGNQYTNLPLHFFYLLNIEYHISNFRHLSIYFFLNYITYLHSYKQHKPWMKIINSIHIYETNIGSGIKFYIPIKKLSNIRLEYSINHKGEHFFGLRTDSEYNE